MANIVAGNIMAVRFWTGFGNQAAVNTRYWACETSVNNGGTEAQFATALESNFPAAYKPLMGSGASYLGFQIQRVWPVPPLVATPSTVSAGAGTGAGDMLAGQVAGLITLRTDFAGRKFRGRVYVPFPSEDLNAATGIPTAGYLTNLAVLGNRFLLDFNIGAGDSSHLVPCLPSKTLVPGSDPPRFTLNGQFTILRTMSARTAWATQRRRGGFGRPNLSPI